MYKLKYLKYKKKYLELEKIMKGGDITLDVIRQHIMKHFDLKTPLDNPLQQPPNTWSALYMPIISIGYLYLDIGEELWIEDNLFSRLGKLINIIKGDDINIKINIVSYIIYDIINGINKYGKQKLEEEYNKPNESKPYTSNGDQQEGHINGDEQEKLLQTCESTKDLQNIIIKLYGDTSHFFYLGNIEGIMMLIIKTHYFIM